MCGGAIIALKVTGYGNGLLKSAGYPRSMYRSTSSLSPGIFRSGATRKKVMRFTRTPLITSLMILAQDKCNTLQLLNIPYGRKKCVTYGDKKISYYFWSQLEWNKGENWEIGSVKKTSFACPVTISVSHHTTSQYLRQTAGCDTSFKCVRRFLISCSSEHFFCLWMSWKWQKYNRKN